MQKIGSMLDTVSTLAMHSNLRDSCTLRRRFRMARVLVVDDDDMIRLVVKSILERQGHAVVLAECGHDGAEAIEAYAFDVAIVDILMPDMNGFETIRAFRRSAPALPIIV